MRVNPTTGSELAVDDVRRWMPDWVEVNRPTLHQSSIGAWFRCRFYFLLSEILRIGTKGYQRTFYIGQLVHLGMAALLRGLTWDEMSQVVTGAIDEERAKLQAFAEESAQSDLAQTISDEVVRDGGLALVLVAVLWAKYGESLTRDYEVIDTESTITADLSDHGIARMGEGRLDVLLRSRSTGMVYILDFKTSGVSIRSYLEELDLEPQPKFYRLLVESDPATKARGSLGGMIHMVIMKPTIEWKVRPSDKFPQGQSWSEYLEECRDWFEAKDDAIGAFDANGQPVLFKSGPRKGSPKPRWEHSDKAQRWSDDPPVQPSVRMFLGPVLSGEFRGMAQEVHRAMDMEPTLTNFPRTGKMNWRCRGCKFRQLCLSPTSEWAERVDRWFQPRASEGIDHEVPAPPTVE